MPESLREILAREPWEAVEGFLRRWHGWTPSRNLLPGAEHVPPALRPVYAALGSAPALYVLGHLVPPAELIHRGGRTVFFGEDQWVYEWAIDDEGAVWMRDGEDVAWTPAAPDTGVFLLQLLLSSAAIDPPHGVSAAWTDREPPLPVLALPPWDWDGPTRWYAGDAAIAFACPNRDELSVWVGALDPADLPEGEWD